MLCCVMLNRPLVVSHPHIWVRLNPWALFVYLEMLKMAKTAILIDGGFYRKRARHLWGEKTAEERARELESYCKAHLRQKDRGVERQLYRIFY